MLLLNYLTLYCFTILLLVLYLWLKHRFSYWHRHKIPYIKPTLLLGNLKELLLFRTSFGEFFQGLHLNTTIDANAAVLGIYVLHTPALLIRDPDLIRLILIKDFNTFLNRYEAANLYHDAMGALSLPLAKYPIWRESRRRLSEFFTSGRLKQRIYPLMLSIAKDLESHIAKHFEEPGQDAVIVELKEICALYTTDLTALQSYSVWEYGLKSGDSDMRKQCRILFEANFLKALHFFLVFFMPHLTRQFRATVFTKKYTNFWRRKVRAIIKLRLRKEKYRIDGDLIDILMKFQNDTQNQQLFEYVQHADFIAAQAAIFMLAGFETSSSVMAFALYELAKQPDIQNCLRLELKRQFEQTKTDEISYEYLTDTSSYLHMIVAETLRLYPAAAFINRECTPGTNEQGFSLEPFANFTMPKDMPAYISILGIQRDARYWPDPDKFDPLRFKPAAVNKMHPMTYIPFGAGPHSCIGSRLGLLQVKLGLVIILKNYKIEVCSKTVTRIKFNPKSFMLQSVDGIFLRLVKDNLLES